MATSLQRPMRADDRRRVPDDSATTAPTRPKPPVAAPFAGQQSTTTPIGTANQQIQDALTTFERAWGDIAAAEQRGELTPDGRSAMVADADQSGAVDEAVAQAAARAEKAEADYKAARAGLAPRSNTVVDSLRHNQWWSRTVRELDAAPAEKLVGTSQRLIETADGPELGWAATELGSYLRSRNVPDDWLDATLHQVSPTLKAAAEQRRTATQAAQIVTANGRSAKKAMRDAGHGSYKRPRLVNPSPKYDPDAQAKLVGAQRGLTTRDGYRP
jgi:hypothetical protein